jgi:hypothetical protein
MKNQCFEGGMLVCAKDPAVVNAIAPCGHDTHIALCALVFA